MAETQSPSLGAGRAALPLLILRIATGYFMLLWALEKIIKPESGVGIFSFFYGIEIGTLGIMAIGLVQLLIVLAFMAGFMRIISYGLVFLMHAISILATWQHLLDPFGLYLVQRPNHLFFAGVPVLAAIWLLFVLRDLDTHTIAAHGSGPEK